MSEQTAPAKVTFEDGYEELKRLVAEVDDEEITVHEMCEKFARGKGLERALRAYLDQQQGTLQEIEQGRNVPDITIVAPSKHDGGDGSDEQDFGPPPPAPVGGSDDDIPF